MTTTIRRATSADYAAIAALWTARAADDASWILSAADARAVTALVAAGSVLHVAVEQAAIVGFAATMRLGARVRLLGSAAGAPEFYALVSAAAEYWLAQGATRLTAFCRAADSNEKTWVGPLRVMQFHAVATDPRTKSAEFLEGDADLSALLTAARAALGGP